MSKFVCNSCKGTYVDVQPDGTAYYHACPPGTENPRDERPRPGLQRILEKWHEVKPHPEERVPVLQPTEYGIVAEGTGRTPID